MTAPPRPRLVTRSPARTALGWIAGALVAGGRWLAEQSAALVGVGLVCGGVYVLCGLGWTLITAGIPCCAAYLLRSWLLLRRRE